MIANGLIEIEVFWPGRCMFSGEFGINPVAIVDAAPAEGDFFVRPVHCAIGVKVHYQVNMVAHDGVAHDVHGEISSELFQAFEEDVFAVVMVAVGDRVLAEKKGTSNTSGSKVIEARVEWIDVVGPRFGHLGSLENIAFRSGERPVLEPVR